MPAKRSARPVRITPWAIMSPPSTSHIVAEAKPENTTCAGATASTIARVKNRNPVMCSGSAPTAHSPIVSTTSAAARMVAGSTPAGAGMKKTVTAAATTSAVRIGTSLVTVIRAKAFYQSRIIMSRLVSHPSCDRVRAGGRESERGNTLLRPIHDLTSSRPPGSSESPGRAWAHHGAGNRNRTPCPPV
jgi:hypothetical protein